MLDYFLSLILSLDLIVSALCRSRSQLYLEKSWHANIASVLPRQAEFLLILSLPVVLRIGIQGKLVIISVCKY